MPYNVNSLLRHQRWSAGPRAAWGAMGCMPRQAVTHGSNTLAPTPPGLHPARSDGHPLHPPNTIQDVFPPVRRRSQPTRPRRQGAPPAATCRLCMCGSPQPGQPAATCPQAPLLHSPAAASSAPGSGAHSWPSSGPTTRRAKTLGGRPPDPVTGPELEPEASRNRSSRSCTEVRTGYGLWLLTGRGKTSVMTKGRYPFQRFSLGWLDMWWGGYRSWRRGLHRCTAAGDAGRGVCILQTLYSSIR
jgi:hypothetical protein